MGASSKISWTHHTFNPWWGCTKVSAACASCYAETFAKRVGLKIWGDDAERRFFGAKHWNEPVAWNTLAEHAGVRARVFCSSMADVFEDRADVEGERQRLWALINSTPWLDWLLLTKRPENIVDMLPSAWRHAVPSNVWLGATAEDRASLVRRASHLIRVRAPVHFLSCEPLLEDIADELEPFLGRVLHSADDLVYDGINWVIVGGESGPRRRPFEPDWLTRIVDVCDRENVVVHVKQDAHLYPGQQGSIPNELWERKGFPEVRA